MGRSKTSHAAGSAREFVAGAVCGIGIILCSLASAAEPTTTESTERTESAGPQLLVGTPPPSPDSVDEDLAEAEARHAGILKYGPVSIIDPIFKDFNKALDDVGLKIGFAYTAVFQAASGGPGIRDAAGGDADLFGNWRLLGPKDGKNNGYLYFASEYRHDLGTGIAPNALGGQVGSLWGTTNGFSEQVIVVKELYWQQHISGDRVIVCAGKLDPENHYDSNYWQSDSKYFLNQAFSSFPVRAFPGNGLGMNLTTKFSEQWYVSTGFQDAQGKKTEAGFDTLFEDFNLFGALELGFTPTIEKLGRGQYRLTTWYRDAGDSNGKPHDAGIDLSIDQHFGKHWVPFFRYGAGEGNINGIEQMISGGTGWEGQILTKSDVIGMAGSWGQPSDHSLDDQFAAEVFYRLQVSPDNQFTIGYQVIVDPSFSPGDDVVGVFEMRWRISM